MPAAGVESPPGRHLATARESSGLSVADVARQLKLSPWQVEAMEADQYQRLPGAVFVRGFIRNYARLVKLDPVPLLANVERQLPVMSHAVSEAPHSADIPFPNARRVHWHKYAIGALLAVTVLVVFEFYWNWTDMSTEVTVQSRPVALPQPQAVPMENPAATEGVAQTAPVNDAEVKLRRSAAPPPVAGEKSAAEGSTTADKTAKTGRKPGEHQLRLMFEKESWVEIRDRDGRRIFSQLNSAGTAQSISGRPPLTLVVGNAAGVQLMHNDKPVDLAPHIKVDVARLTLE